MTPVENQTKKVEILPEGPNTPENPSDAKTQKVWFSVSNLLTVGVFACAALGAISLATGLSAYQVVVLAGDKIVTVGGPALAVTSKFFMKNIWTPAVGFASASWAWAAKNITTDNIKQLGTSIYNSGASLFSTAQ